MGTDDAEMAQPNYNCWNCSQFENRLDAIDAGYEHAVENALCMACRKLDDVTHDIAVHLEGYLVISPGKILCEDLAFEDKWIITIKGAKDA
jgi:hypothetical protein